ncbi:MAG TPA: fibronectin type III domain-containing protein [Spirochaetota bacterium]|nr:fibronectin type III domain-containing protein [Spirochaetota bacterium]
MSFRRYTVTLFIIQLILITLPGIRLYAEHVFKKDGAIIKGSIIADDIASISVRNDSGTIERIPRNEIMRIIYTDLYLGKVYVRLTTGEMVEGYQVDEDRDDFYFRRDITKPEEFKIPRKKVMFIARTNPTDLSGKASTDNIILTWSPPFKPAKFYRIYIRDVKAKEETYRLLEETDDLSCEIKNLKKSWIYEIYATAVSDTGEESLPSEKVVVNTLPEPPGKLVINEQYSGDGKNVTLTLTWRNVTDPESRVKSYIIYETEGKERIKKGSSPGSEFVIKDFPAEGRHWFSVVAVNDLFTESDEIKAVYDAGYKVYIRTMTAYLYPRGILPDLASSGYGVLLDAGISAKKYSIGVETGYYIFNCEEGVESMSIAPALIEMNYTLPLFYNFSLRGIIKCGAAYSMIEYTVHDTENLLISNITKNSGFDFMSSAGVSLKYDISDRINICGGAEYSIIFESSGRMEFAAVSVGAGITF